MSGESIEPAFVSTSWRDAVEDTGLALGVTISVVDPASGATLNAGGVPCACSPLFGAEPLPGLTCLSAREATEGPGPGDIVHGTCAAGMRVVLAPVQMEGSVVCEVMVSGFVGSERERASLRGRLVDAGSDAASAEATAASVVIFDRQRAEAAVRAVVSRAEGLLRERACAAERTARGCELAMLTEAAKHLMPQGLTRQPVPEQPLRSLMRLTGASTAMISFSSREHHERDPFVAGEAPDDAAARLIDETVAHVRSTGRAIVTKGSGEDQARLSLVAVPIVEAGGEPTVLILLKSEGESLGTEDVRFAELFSETLGAMLLTASQYVDANMKLVELVQVNEVARLLNSTLDMGKLEDVSVEVLLKTLSFDVGGFVLDGFGERRGRVAHVVEVGDADLDELLTEVLGPGENGPRAGIEVVDRSAGAEPAGEPQGERDWVILSRELRFRNTRAGELFVASATPGRFDADDERVLGALSAHLSIALENAALYSRLQADFERAIAALSALADATERLDSGHTDRVMDYAVSLGEYLGLSAERVGLLRFAGLLHDLGKIGVAEEILVKPAALTDDEMELVKRHSEMGANIVEQVRILEELTPIVRHHHERWDGTGYPQGLAGEDIPLEARILAVADSFEAMTGKRPHRRSLPVASARIEILRGAGRQFDPDVAEAFLKLLDEREAMGATGGYARLTTGQPESELPS